jgi:hypothetical protein
MEELLNYYFLHIYQGGRKPICKVLPVGGWGETIRFTEASISYLLPAITTVFAVLDNDVEATIQTIQQNPNRTDREQEQLNLYNNNQQRIRFLPITPELGIVTLLTNNPVAHLQTLQDHFNAVFDITQIIQNEAGRVGIAYPQNPRKEAKIRLDFYIQEIKNSTNRDSNYTRIMLARYFADTYCPQNHPILQQLFNPMF